MKRSTTRILTTHTGSLPRPPNLVSLLIEEQAGHGTARTTLDAAIQQAVAEVVHQQAARGLDVINDGERRNDTGDNQPVCGGDGCSGPAGRFLHPLLCLPAGLHFRILGCRGNYATGQAWGVAVQRLLVSTYWAMKPPSITSSVPVIKDASSEARNSTP